MVKAPGCRNEILNAKKLFLADKQADYRRAGIWGPAALHHGKSPGVPRWRNGIWAEDGMSPTTLPGGSITGMWNNRNGGWIGWN